MNRKIKLWCGKCKEFKIVYDDEVVCRVCGRYLLIKQLKQS